MTVLGGLAEFERDLIRARTAEGARAREGARREAWPQAEAHAASAAGSTAAAGAGRNAQGTCQELQRRTGDDFTAYGLAAPWQGETLWSGMMRCYCGKGFTSLFGQNNA